MPPGGPASKLPPGPRFGWIAFWAIAAFLILTQLANYLTRDPKANLEMAREDMELRQAVYASETVRRLRPPGVGEQEVQEERKKALKGLEELAKRLYPQRLAKESAALYFAAIRFEQGQTVARADIAVLERSKDERMRAAAEVYGADALSRERANELSRKLTGRSFVWTLARIHAAEKAGDDSARKREIPASRLALTFALGTFVFFGVLLGGLLLLLFAVSARKKRLAPLGFPPGELSAEDADRYAYRTAQLLAWMLAGALAVEVSLRNVAPRAATSVISGVVIVAGAFLLAKLPVGGRKISLSELGLGSSRLLSHVLWGIAGALANLPLLVISIGLTLLLQRAMPEAQHPLTVELAKGAGPLTALGYFVAAAILAPVFEEVCFRGALLPALASALRSPLGGIVASSVLFAAIHPTGVPAWPALAVIGATAAVLTYHTKSLVPAIVMHGLHNGGLLVFYFAMG